MITIKLLVTGSLLFLACASASIPPAGKNRDAQKPGIRDSDNEADGAHTSHEALFGRGAKRLDDLSPEEGIERLREVVRKIDVDHDNYVTRDELRNWIRELQVPLNLADAKRIWEEHELKPEEPLTWDLYSSQAVSKDGIYDDYDENEKKVHLARDKIRWKIADEDNDGQLTLNEAMSFFNPEFYPKMHDALTQETIDEMDTNKDGLIDVDEYIADLWKPTSGEKEEPEWVKSEREDFVSLRDTNKDGKLDHDEVKAWRFANDYVQTEVEHLFDHCDSDRDGRLSEAEIEARYDLFVSSVATNYGEVFTQHDEL